MSSGSRSTCQTLSLSSIVHNLNALEGALRYLDCLSMNPLEPAIFHLKKQYAILEASSNHDEDIKPHKEFHRH